MRRRDFVALVAAGALPLPVRAQPEMVVAGFLSARSPHEAGAHTTAFLRALTEAGYVPGRNLTVESDGRKATTTGCQRLRLTSRKKRLL